jgi:heme exporter protein B
MNSSWKVEIVAIFKKEWITEWRSRSALLTAGLFGLVSVVAVAFASYGLKLGPGLASGLLWATLLFSAASSLPRTMIHEDEQGTLLLLRLLARPHSVFWGKSLFNLAQMLFSGLVLSLLFFILTGLEIQHFGLYALGLIGSCACLSGAITLCGALVSQASSQSALAGAIALPLLLPLIALGVSALKPALGGGALTAGFQSSVGLVCYAVLLFATGPYLFAAIWGRRSS